MKAELIQFRFIQTCRALSCLLLLWSISAAAGAAQSDDFLAARDAFRVGDAVKLDRYARNLNDYVLMPYIAYWQLRLRLDDATPDEVRARIMQLQDLPIATNLRSDWLKMLGRRQRWDLFDAEYAPVDGDDVDLQCYALQSQLRSNSRDVLSAARNIWYTGRELPDSCRVVFVALTVNGQLGTEDVWTRIRAALTAGNNATALRASAFLPAGNDLDERTLSSISVNPQAYLNRGNFNLANRNSRELVMFAVQRLARSAPPLAAQQWSALEARYSDADRNYVWGVIAMQSAQRLDPDALNLFRRVTAPNDAQLAWKVRAALRAGRWPLVLAAIEAMSAKQAQEPAWRYWKARALKDQGRNVEAQALLTPLASDFSFYGQLAADDLGQPHSIPAVVYRPSEDDITAAAAVGGFQRAMEFYRLNLRTEGAREWNWTIRNFDDKQLLSAAELARRNGLYDRAITTADRTVQLHDFTLRYLAPYRDLMKDYSAQQNLDEAFVYGLIRQESRFISSAKSGVGASGLMQLMPATARWAAGKVGIRNFQVSQSNVIETNINLGTWYLKHVLDLLDSQPLLASAAYNAGPGRARGWQADTPLEGAIYAETIPFNETRDYVKKVMSNAVYYSQRLGFSGQSLKQRIGVVAARGSTSDKSVINDMGPQ